MHPKTKEAMLGLSVLVAIFFAAALVIGLIFEWAEAEDHYTWDKADTEGNCYIYTEDVNTFGWWHEDPDPVITTYCRED